MGQLQILKASAGSGKTFMLAYEYVKNVITEPISYKNILAVTFTKKATGEMKSRILDELFNLTQPDGDKAFLTKLITEEHFEETDVRQRAARALNLILHDYSNFSVMTIDGFFQKIVRSFIKELHLECDYTIDFNSNYLLKMAIDNLIKKSEEDTQLKEWLEAFMDDTIEASKRVDLKKEMLSLSKMILGDEFDKSYFEKHRGELITFFNQLSVKAEEITKEMVAKANDFLNYCNTNGISMEDLPGKSTGIYSYMKKMSNGTILKCSNKIGELTSPTSKWAKLPHSTTDDLRNLFTQLHELVNQNMTFLRTIEAVLDSHRTFVLLADISSELYEICSRDNKMLLSNTNYLINRLIKNNDTPYIYEKIGNYYQIIMIDEFQDTSTGQWENFRPLLENSLSESPSERAVVTLVGDVKQSIYRWRGGDWRILGGGINSAFYGNTIREENLVTNYRSSAEVIHFNNQIIRNCVTQLNENLNSTLDKLRDDDKIAAVTHNEYSNLLEEAYRGMEQHCPSKGKEGGYVEVIKYDENENLNEVIRVIKELQGRGYNAGDIAILVRNKKAAKSITAHILDYKRNNPTKCENYCFDIIASDGLSLNRSVVIKFIMAVYSLSEKERPATLALYNRYLGRDLTTEIPQEEKEFIASLLHLPATGSFEKITQWYKLGENPNNIAYLQAFHTAVIKFSGAETADAASLLQWWGVENENLSVSLPEGQNAINIETIHKSKGLQYKIVIIPYCNWGLAPMSHDNYFWAETTDERLKLPNGEGQKIIVSYKKSLEESFFSPSYVREQILTYIENFNIFYVALTRAVQELYVMIPTKSRGSNNINHYIENAVGDTLIHGEKREYRSNPTERSAIYIDRFNHCDTTSRITLHTESDKFFKDMEEEAGSVDARGKGILLHKLFESATSLEELPQAIEKLSAGGFLSKQEALSLTRICEEALENPIVRGWFDDQWETRSESSILLPTEPGEIQVRTKRPDRVLIKGDSAIVIDYKFGHENRSHYKQIIQYKELLHSMGYNEVKGYLWYINNNIIAEV